jgi:suppressor of fused protein SUFU
MIVHIGTIERVFRMSEQDDGQELWNARQSGLESLLGKADDTMLHAVIPLYLGGNADVLRFRNYVKGVTYATCDLAGDEAQVESSIGSYELMMCTREDCDWAPNIISQLARYTLETPLNPGETMDIGPATPEGSTIAAFLFHEPDDCEQRFHVNDKECGLLLCLGITAAEQAACRSGGLERLVMKLRTAGIFPFTDLYRNSVL